MVGVRVVDEARLGERGDGDQGNARPVAEEVERLDVPGVVVAAALVGRDQDGGLAPHRGVRLHPRDQVDHEALVLGRVRIGGVARHALEGPDERDRGERRVARHVLVELRHVLQVVLERGRHDRGEAGQGIADPAVFLTRGPARAARPAARVILPGDTLRRERVADRRKALRRERELVGRPEGLRLAAGREAEAVVVHEIVVAGLAVAVGPVAERVEVAADLAHAGLAGVGAVHVRAAGVAVLRVEVVRLGLGIGHLDLVERRDFRRAAHVVEAGVARHERDEVGTRPAHDRLVVVVGDGVAAGELREVRRVPGAHVEEAHRLTALEGVAGRRCRRAVLRPDAHGDGDPREQVELALVDLLPHLPEPVDRVAREGVVGHVLGDLEGAVRQVGGEARIGHAGRHADGIGGLGLRERRVAPGLGGGEQVDLGIAGLLLGGRGEVRSRRAVRLDDALGQEIRDGLVVGRLVAAEQVVEGMILANDHDQVSDRRPGGLATAIVVLRRGAGGRTDRGEGGEPQASQD